MSVLEGNYFLMANIQESNLCFSLLAYVPGPQHCKMCQSSMLELVRARANKIATKKGRYCSLCEKDESGLRIALFKNRKLSITVSTEFWRIRQFVNLSNQPNSCYFALLLSAEVLSLHVFQPGYITDRKAAIITSEPFPGIYPSNCLYFFNNPEPNCLIWDPELRVIRPFLEIVGYENIPCDEKPTLLTCSKVGVFELRNKN